MIEKHDKIYLQNPTVVIVIFVFFKAYYLSGTIDCIKETSGKFDFASTFSGSRGEAPANS